MTSPMVRAFLGSAGLLVLLVGWWAIRLEPARSAAHQALQRELTASKDLARLAALQNQEARVVAHRLPDNDLVTRVQQALTLAGLTAASFNGVQPIAEQVDPISRLRQRRVLVRLQSLTPAQVGAWLAAWSTGEQPWLVESLSLVHALDSAASGGMDSNSFTTSVTLLTRSVEDVP